MSQLGSFSDMQKCPGDGGGAHAEQLDHRSSRTGSVWSGYRIVWRMDGPSNAGTQWVAGYLSGLNIAAHAQARDALSTDFVGVMSWIDNYYRSNPLDPIMIVAKR